jgi:hypothetical protein
MRYTWLQSNALVVAVFCGLAISALAQTVPSRGRISANCRFSSDIHPYCKQSPIAVLDVEPVLRTQLDSLIGHDLYTCARYIEQVAEFDGALYRAVQDSGKAALPIAVQAFEPLKIERVYSGNIPYASGYGFYIVVRLKSNLLGGVRSDAHPDELRTSQDPMFSLLRNMADRAYSDLAKAPFTQGEIDAIEQHVIEIGTTESVANCALGTPLDKVVDARHRAVYLYANGARITVDDGYVVAIVQARKQ